MRKLLTFNPLRYTAVIVALIVIHAYLAGPHLFAAWVGKMPAYLMWVPEWWTHVWKGGLAGLGAWWMYLWVRNGGRSRREPSLRMR